MSCGDRKEERALRPRAFSTPSLLSGGQQFLRTPSPGSRCSSTTTSTSSATSQPNGCTCEADSVTPVEREQEGRQEEELDATTVLKLHYQNLGDCCTLLDSPRYLRMANRMIRFAPRPHQLHMDLMRMACDNSTASLRLNQRIQKQLRVVLSSPKSPPYEGRPSGGGGSAVEGRRAGGKTVAPSRPHTAPVESPQRQRRRSTPSPDHLGVPEWGPVIRGKELRRRRPHVRSSSTISSSSSNSNNPTNSPSWESISACAVGKSSLRRRRRSRERSPTASVTSSSGGRSSTAVPSVGGGITGALPPSLSEAEAIFQEDMRQVMELMNRAPFRRQTETFPLETTTTLPSKEGLMSRHAAARAEVDLRTPRESSWQQRRQKIMLEKLRKPNPVLDGLPTGLRNRLEDFKTSDKFQSFKKHHDLQAVRSRSKPLPSRHEPHH